MLRRIHIRRRIKSYSHCWPIDEKAGALPSRWLGWPEGKQFALVLTHDVEGAGGLAKCGELMELEERLGFRSCFFVVPERYRIPPGSLSSITSRGFELGVHGLTHDGKLYSSRGVFTRRAVKINSYLREWNSLGFRSPLMQHNLEWLRDLDILYDASTFDTDPFEPHPDGMRTIFPFMVPARDERRGYVELPYTLPQDHTLYILMREKDNELWRKKLDWVAAHGGMALFISHPDYMGFDVERMKFYEYPVHIYEEFLVYIKTKYEGHYWHALPREMARYWIDIMAQHDFKKRTS